MRSSIFTSCLFQGQDGSQCFVKGEADGQTKCTLFPALPTSVLSSEQMLCGPGFLNPGCASISLGGGYKTHGPESLIQQV